MSELPERQSAAMSRTFFGVPCTEAEHEKWSEAVYQHRVCPWCLRPLPQYRLGYRSHLWNCKSKPA